MSLLKRWRRLSVSIRTIALAAILLLALWSVPALISVNAAQRAIERDHARYGGGLASLVAGAVEGAMANGDIDEVQQLMGEVIRDSPLLDSIVVRTLGGRIIGGVGNTEGGADDARTYSALISQPPGRTPAYAVVRLRPDNTAEGLEVRAREIAIALLAGLITMVLALGLALHRSIGRPLRVLVDQATQLREGDLESPVAVAAGSGEYSELAESLDTMRIRVRDQLSRFQALTDELSVEIVERRSAELKLREGKARTDAILEAALDGIITFDESGCIVEFNPAAERVFGHARRQALGHDLGALLEPTDGGQGLARFLEAPDPTLLGRRLESELRRADGARFPAELTISAIEVPTGCVYTAFVRDITNQKRDEARALHQLRLKEITQSASAAFLVSDDLDGRIRAMLRETGETLRADRTFLIRYRDERKWLYHTHEWVADGTPPKGGTERASAAEAWTTELLQGRVIHYDPDTIDDLPAALRDDIEKRGILSLLVLPVFIFGQLEAIVGFEMKRIGRCWLDEEVTVLQAIVESFSRAVERRVAERERQRAEVALREALAKAQSASKMKTDFLANMSHEIRTPMTAILGYADLAMRSRERPDDVEQWLRSIRSSADHLLALLNDILDLSKIEAGQMSLSLERCSPIAVILETERLLRSRAVEKMVDLNVEFTGLMPRSIESDVVRLRQILVNLVGNAIKFTDEGQVVIRASAEAHDGRIILTVDVIDTGIGINQEQLGIIFEPFRQADNQKQRRHGGTGLGLDISQRLARILSGAITVVSTPGEGSCFTVRLDVGAASEVELVSPDDAMPAADTSEDVEQTVSLAGRRILVVDDNPDNRRIISFLLVEAKAEVEEAENGAIGVETARARAEGGRPFDVILMDMQMPVMDGYTATKTLRDAGFTLPIIALTAHAMTGDQERCLSVGCDEYVSKPIIPASFFAAIERQLDGERSAPRVAAPAPAPAPALAPALAPTPAPESPPAADASASLLDNPAFAPLVKEYAASLGEKIEAIETARAAGERDGLRVLAHRLKGTAANFGFAEVTEAARACEAIIREDGPDGALDPAVQALIGELRTAYARAA